MERGKSARVSGQRQGPRLAEGGVSPRLARSRPGFAFAEATGGGRLPRLYDIDMIYL